MKNEPVVTEKNFDKMEALVRAIEVLTGQEVYPAKFDFKTNRGAVRVGGVEHLVRIIHYHTKSIVFDFDGEFKAACRTHEQMFSVTIFAIQCIVRL